MNGRIFRKQIIAHTYDFIIIVDHNIILIFLTSSLLLVITIIVDINKRFRKGEEQVLPCLVLLI